MNEPPSTRELLGYAAFLVHQAKKARDRLEGIQECVDVTGDELPPATRREIFTELSAAAWRLHLLLLAVAEPRRASPFEQ